VECGDEVCGVTAFLWCAPVSLEQVRSSNKKRCDLSVPPQSKNACANAPEAQQISARLWSAVTKSAESPLSYFLTYFEAKLPFVA
jgi:hypothetical protein